MQAEFSRERFRDYVCAGDSIVTAHNGINYRATVEHDDDTTAPPDRQDGYWPSLNPKSDGYIGDKSPSTLRRHMKRAQATLDAWKNDEWFYCGIVISAFIVDDDGDEIPLVDHAASLWGIECNYPELHKRRRRNEYLDECANDLLAEAVTVAEAERERIHKATA